MSTWGWGNFKPPTGREIAKNKRRDKELKKRKELALGILEKKLTRAETLNVIAGFIDGNWADARRWIERVKA